MAKEKKMKIKQKLTKVKNQEKKQSSDKKKQDTVKKEAEKSTERPARAKVDVRTVLLGVFGIFIAFVMGWGVCQTVRSINTAGQMNVVTAEPIKKIEDNSRNEGKKIDVDALVEKVLDQVAFDAELNKLDDSVAEGMIETTEGTKLQIYMGNGTYADELLVMTAKSEADAKKNQEYAAAHLQEAKSTFRDYIPKEAKKVENALNIRCGCYVIVCVTSDYETAEQVINSVIKK